MKRMLMVASVPSMIGQFNMNNIKILQELRLHVIFMIEVFGMTIEYRLLSKS